MKTKFTLIAWLLCCCAILFIFPAKAQFTHFPTNGAPIYGQANVAHGNLDNLDQKTSPIWFKVNGNIVGPQPHNKMHPYVTPGSQVLVNFNVNKNVSNRYTLVSYKVLNNGKRVLYDYHSNHFNLSPPAPPVQGNSNQQQVLVPTCRFEVYFVKGALSTEWNGPIPDPNNPYNPATDISNTNPYLSDASVPMDKQNRILDFAYGGPNAECNDCPAVVVPTGAECVYPRLLEVIDLPATQEKELIFSVANTINTNTTGPLDPNFCGTGWPEIGDILFTNIFPSHTGNNQPYSFRYDYQLGPQIPLYPTAKKGVPLSAMSNVYNLAPGYERAFVFDQRNNHNNWDYDVYQSEIVRYKMPYAEYDRLNTPGNTPTPQICIELSPKHPEPHTSLEPIYCFNLAFECELEEPCTEAESASGDIVAQVPTEYFSNASGNFEIPVRIFNYSSSAVTSVDVTAGSPEDVVNSIPAFPVRILAPADGSIYTKNYTYSVANDNIDNAVFTGTNTANFRDGNSDLFIITVNAEDFVVNGGGGLLTIQVNTGATSATLELFAGDCGIINPLPVELLTFSGAPAAGGIDLKWSTASEKNNDRFEVERSANGINFEKIGVIKGKGTTNLASDYTLLDKRPLKGLNYYRLKQVDFDGKHEFSKIIKVSSDKDAVALGVQLIPNPCSDQNCSVLLKGIDTSKPVVVEMKDLTGRVVLSQQIASDQTSFNLPKANLGKGIYILSARNGENITYQKVIIQ